MDDIQLSPEDVIKHRWFTAGNGDLWGTEGTYAAIEFRRLPPLPAVLHSFDWLTFMPNRDYGCTLDNEDNQLEGFVNIQSKLKVLGFNIPEDFAMFVERPDIRAQIPSCTGCYLDLSDTVLPLPGFSNCYVLRFMNDSQSCVLWYLLFQRNKSVRVLASTYFIERDIFDAMEYTTDLDTPLPYNDVLKNSCICADSFKEFIFRFCIENAIWFATHCNFLLSPYELDYLNNATKRP